MKKISIALLALVVVATGVIFAFAQTAETGQRDGKSRSGFGKRGGHHKFGGMMFRGVDLTDAQKAQVKSIREASRAKMAPIREQMKAAHEKMRAATANGSFDEGLVTAIANEQALLMAQMNVERHRVQAQTFAILTDEQKTKVAEMKAKMKERRGKRGFKRGGKKRGDAPKAVEAPVN